MLSIITYGADGQFIDKARRRNLTSNAGLSQLRVQRTIGL